MSSETLNQRMADLARDLQSEGSAERTLQHIVDSAVHLVEPCTAAGISLATRQGEIRTSASSNEVPARGDELQMRFGEGPCIDAVWEEHVISVPDLTQEERWPQWAPRAVDELGMRSMLCLRLFTHEDLVGALNLYATELRAFGPEDVEEGESIAAHAAVAVVAAERIDNLESALHNRTVIGQATGIVMERYQMNSAAAFNLLARLSSEQNRKVAVIARELVASFEADTGA